MKPRAAALALAAPLLFTAPALADQGKSSTRVNGTISIQTENGGLHLNLGDRGYRSYGYNTGRHYGHNNRRDVRRMKRRAIRACRRAIRAEADYLGFRDVDFDDGRYAERIGPRGFRVTFNEVEFEGRRRDFERPVTCIVRRGDEVRQIHGIPRRGDRGHRRGHRGHRGYY
ncbi:MAG: hypothetical protein NXH78_16555 [Hyphomonadaceae bacterium]|nr:hypothetical protein [Hyphomonadaceae bacterium]